MLLMFCPLAGVRTEEDTLEGGNVADVLSISLARKIQLILLATFPCSAAVL